MLIVETIKLKLRKKNNETNNWFFEIVIKIDKPLLRLPKKEKTQTTNVRNETGDIITDNTDINEYWY